MIDFPEKMKFFTTKTKLDNKILCVGIFENNIYLGLGKQFINYTQNKILCVHEKSVRHIASSDQNIGCCSYDGTATVFKSNDVFVDKIEGPDTEIKGMAFSKEFIALTTRGKTTWVLENLEISKILDDHLHDVKGCIFNEDCLFTWSYDETIKIYELFKMDNSWELIQSIEAYSIIWSVIFYHGYLVAALQDGSIQIYEKEGSLWTKYKTLKLSVSPIYCCTMADGYLAVQCNRNCIMLLDNEFKKVIEIDELNTGCDILSCCYDSKKKQIICGSEDGILSVVQLH